MINESSWISHQKLHVLALLQCFFESLHIYQDVNYTGFVHDYREKHFYKLYGYVTADEVASSNWYKFKVVRNPYSRAVSSYFHTMNLLWRSFFKHSNVFLLYYYPL
jgi:hypothetical protein